VCGGWRCGVLGGVGDDLTRCCVGVLVGALGTLVATCGWGLQGVLKGP